MNLHSFRLKRKKSLRAEFEQKFPQVIQSEKNIQRLNKRYIILIFLFILIGLAGLITAIISPINKWWAVTGIGAGCFVFGIVGVGILYYFACKIDKIDKMNAKQFQVWLKKEKHIHLSVIYTNKSEQRIYEEINID